MDAILSLIGHLFALIRWGIKLTVIVLILAIARWLFWPEPIPPLDSFFAQLFNELLETGPLVLGAAKIFSNTWFLIVLALIAAPLYYYVHRFNADIGGKIGVLKGASFDLVRLMETTLDGTQGRAEKLNDIVHRYAVAGPEAISKTAGNPVSVQPPASPDATRMPPPSMGMGLQINLPGDLTQAGLTMMEKRLADMKSFGASNNAVRAGLATFLLLMDQGNLGSAYTNLIEYMKKQRDDEKKSMPNFVDLKRFFYLPTHWPAEEEPEKLQARGLTWYQANVLSAAITRGRKTILKSTVYNPPTPEGEKPITISGDNVLKSMRRFLYTPGTKLYDPSLADNH
jgi:hypothetical protein